MTQKKENYMEIHTLHKALVANVRAESGRRRVGDGVDVVVSDFFVTARGRRALARPCLSRWRASKQRGGRWHG